MAHRTRIQTALIISGAVVASLFFIVVALQTRRVSHLAGEVAELRSAFQRESSERNDLDVYLESNQRTVARHLREVRELLNLSPGEYRFPENEGPSGDEDEFDTASEEALRYPDELFFSGVDRIEEELRITELERTLATALPRIADEAFRELDASDRNRFTLRPVGRLRWEVTDDSGERWITIIADLEQFTVTTLFDETSEVVGTDRLGTTLVEEIEAIDRRIRRYRDGRDSFRTLLSSRELTSRIEERGLAFGALDESPGEVTQTFVSERSGDPAFTVSLERDPWGYTVDGDRTESFEAFRTLLEDRIAATDPRTAVQRRTEASFKRIREIAETPAFQGYLSERGLAIDPEPRETLDFFLFDIVDSGDKLFGSFAVQKEGGDIYLTDDDEIVITRLENAEAEPLVSTRAAHGTTGDRPLPDEFPPGFQAGRTDGTNILLLGTHEKQADSIMLVHLSPEKTVSMISIPRDIWWRQRKLNEFHGMYGSEALVEEVSDLIDQPIEGWISIDMYAFIDVVDILGGIEVTLREPLIDPTYRVREDGSWGTLYYEAGTHHLGGIEALRLARSRHTSNDFERASRQQMILSALRARLNELHAGDLDRVYELVQTINRYIESSYSAWELAQFYLRYRNAEIVNRTGLTFDNVLYATWSNLYLQGVTIEEVDDDFYRGAWILLPREDDWSVIPWFVEQNLR
ncbi:MAG: LCP family protein [Alkalispirochaeta sp.]